MPKGQGRSQSASRQASRIIAQKYSVKNANKMRNSSRQWCWYSENLSMFTDDTFLIANLTEYGYYNVQYASIEV